MIHGLARFQVKLHPCSGQVTTVPVTSPPASGACLVRAVVVDRQNLAAVVEKRQTERACKDLQGAARGKLLDAATATQPGSLVAAVAEPDPAGSWGGASGGAACWSSSKPGSPRSRTTSIASTTRVSPAHG